MAAIRIGDHRLTYRTGRSFGDSSFRCNRCGEIRAAQSNFRLFDCGSGNANNGTEGETHDGEG